MNSPLSLAVDLLDAAVEQGGGTFQANGQQVQSDHFRSDVWVVGGKVESLMLGYSRGRYLGSRSVEIVARWLDQNHSDYYGSWLNDDNGLIYIDAVDLVEDELDAVVLGKERGELAIYNIATGKTVTLADCSLGDGYVTEVEG